MTLTLPTAKTKPTTDLAKQSILLYGVPKLGKCLAGNSVLYDPTSGQPVTLADLVTSKEGAVLSMGMAGIIKSADPTDYIDNGEAMLFRITTQSGRTIDATAEHPFLTREGWAPLSVLKENDKIGVVAEYSSLFGTVRTEPEFLKVLAYLLAVCVLV
jgi:replicative DNA helicase